MAHIKARPAIIEIVRRGKCFTYELADFKDWGVLFDGTVLEIKARDGIATYWPIDAVTYWRVR